MTAAVQLAFDCDPTWPTDCQPSDRAPTPHDCRQHEIHDQRGQAAAPLALWTAHDVPTGSYL